jgi:3-oxoacyl-[acyl-carrier protein] reductase
VAPVKLDLTGKRAAVAAASTGLGFAIAQALSAEGCRVAICSRSLDRVEAAARTIREETGGEVSVAEVDVAADGAVGSWIDRVADGWGGLDLVVANAGGPRPGTFADLGPEDWDAAYRLTLRSALETARAARPHLSRGSSLLLMTSVAVKEPVGTLLLSTVFRSGVAALAKLLADEWAPYGIRVNQLIPGRIATDRITALDDDAAQKAGTSVEEVRARVLKAIPLGRYGLPQEYAAAAVFLLSGAASYITGASLQLDGGMLRSVT